MMVNRLSGRVRVVLSYTRRIMHTNIAIIAVISEDTRRTALRPPRPCNPVLPFTLLLPDCATVTFAVRSRLVVPLGNELLHQNINGCTVDYLTVCYI